MAKGYNRYNHLQIVQEACEHYNAHACNYETVEDYYIQSFYPKFKRSRATMYNWLATPYKRDLKQIQEDREKQLNLFK